MQNLMDRRALSSASRNDPTSRRSRKSDWRCRKVATCAPTKECDEALTHEAHKAAPAWLQVLCGADRFCDRAGADGRRRSKRMRQIEPGRGSALGHGRVFAQIHARRVDGRRDFFGVEYSTRA